MSSKKLLSRTAVSSVGRRAALFLSGLLAITACSGGGSKASSSGSSSSGAGSAGTPAPVAQPTATDGDSGAYACSLLSKDEISAAIGQTANDPTPNGGGPPSGPSATGGPGPAKSRCRMSSTGTARATIVSWDVFIFPSADLAKVEYSATYAQDGDEAVPGVGDQAVVGANHQSATILKGPLVVSFSYQDGNETVKQFADELKAGPLPASYVNAFIGLVKAVGPRL
ncbi:MAG: hypothetical protein QOG39_1222 [Acidimicrobiaceae bacterium]